MRFGVVSMVSLIYVWNTICESLWELIRVMLYSWVVLLFDMFVQISTVFVFRVYESFWEVWQVWHLFDSFILCVCWIYICASFVKIYQFIAGNFGMYHLPQRCWPSDPASECKDGGNERANSWQIEQYVWTTEWERACHEPSQGDPARSPGNAFERKKLQSHAAQGIFRAENSVWMY